MIYRNVEKSKGKFFPVFVSDNGDMYSVRMSEEKLELFQLTLRSLFISEIEISPDPINNHCTYAICKSENKY